MTPSAWRAGSRVQSEAWAWIVPPRRIRRVAILRHPLRWPGLETGEPGPCVPGVPAGSPGRRRARDRPEVDEVGIAVEIQLDATVRLPVVHVEPMGDHARTRPQLTLELGA